MDGAITTSNLDEEAPPGPTPEDVERAEIARRVERNNAEAIAQIKRRITKENLNG